MGPNNNIISLNGKMTPNVYVKDYRDLQYNPSWYRPKDIHIYSSTSVDNYCKN